MDIQVVDLTSPPRARISPRSKKIDHVTVLFNTIATVDAHRLRQTVQKLCQKHAPAAEYLAKKLLTSEKAAKDYNDVGTDEESEEKSEEGEEDEEEDDTNDDNKKDAVENDADGQMADEPQERVGQKRKRSRFVICAQCESEFDYAENSREDCVWHSGEQRRQFLSPHVLQLK